MMRDEFMQIMEHGWNQLNNQPDVAKRLGQKFKNMRKILREWHNGLQSLGKAIENNKMLINLSDSLEEFRDLSLEEWSARRIFQNNQETLLQQQKEYWKQRGKIKYATLGDENTRIFHSTATIRHNKNSIMVLKDVNGVAMSKHEDKANILWEAFKERLGKSEFSHIYFDLDSLISGEPGLDDLQAPFTTEEIDAIVSNLPSGKSPGPDGFNTDFLKKC
jgi:hypothetical protein